MATSLAERNGAMSTPKMRTEDVQALAKAVGIELKPENSETIASMLSEVRQSVYAKAAALPQDAPLSVYFDAR
jgi:hypothetical protein